LSKNPPLNLTTPKQKKHMSDFMTSIVSGWQTRSVAEGVVEFTERKRYLSSGTSARPGPFRFAVTPFWREVAECLSEYSRTVEVGVMKGTQTGGTDAVMMNHAAYCIEYGIGPVQYVSSDDELALEHMEKRLAPMIQESGLQEKIIPPVKSKTSRITGDTKRAKSFGGTFLRVTGARSESSLSSLPTRILHIDEIDKYLKVLTGGGNPVEKAIRRADSYNHLKKIVYISTPKKKATSQIEPIFQQGTMEYYNFHCPVCGELQKLEWSRIKWTKDEEGDFYIEYDGEGNVINDPVWMECKNKECDHKIRDYEKVTFLQEQGFGGTAHWIATKKPDRPGIRTFHINALYGFRSWLDVVVQWCKIEGDKDLLQDFINDTLGETYQDAIDKPDMHYLQARAETDWERGQIPNGVKILVLGCDIQKGKAGNGRIEWGIAGYGIKKEYWSSDYDMIAGNPYDPNDPLWDKLEEIIRKDYYKINGEAINIQVAFLDAQGEAAEVVKVFCERFPYSPGSWIGVFPTLGKKTQSDIVKEHTSTIKTPEILLDDQKLKAEIYHHLKKKVPVIGSNYPVGFMHFHAGYSEEYYKQLTAEEVEEIMNTKGTATEYYIHNKKQRRNEVLDVTKMQLGALYYVYFTYFKLWNERRKLRKYSEINRDWSLFWAKMDDDSGVEV